MVESAVVKEFREWSVMGNQLPGRGTVLVLAVIAAAIVGGLFGVLHWNSERDVASVLPSQGRTADPPKSAPADAPGPQAALTPPQQAASRPAEPAGQPAAEAKESVGASATVPSFDVVRVEPNGESVIAGRGAGGATIELLRDGQVHARTAADPTGLFAFVPPPLPPGSHQVTLQSIAPDGTRQRSRQSVTIVVQPGMTGRPLVALASPDRPTVVLSNPETPEPSSKEPSVAAAPTAQAAADAQKLGQETAAAAAAPQQTVTSPSAQPGQRPNVRIASVESEEGGRLYVSGQAAAGATVRLYLNDTFIAPGGAGGDGRVSFAIGRGMKPGEYKVRLDEVDPVSGEVKSRAEVPFTVPVEIAVPLPPAAPTASPSQIAGVPARAGSATSSAASASGRPSGVPSMSSPESAGQQVASVGSPRDLGVNTVVIPDVATAIVSQGDNLWRISQRIYGRGTRFTVIYSANQAQIRNPNLIYPGQVFIVPSNGEKPEPAR
jgi:nucleoid-associated protein YgaU